MARRWQDTAGVVLGAILCLLPWIAGFSGVTGAAASAWVIGAGSVAVFAIAAARPAQWPEWVNLGLAALLLLSPFVLGFTGVAAALWSHWLLGMLIGLDALWALARVSTQSAEPEQP